ncbi:MAG: tripartite tricarboxylate transporter TctB family protein [Lachnospiraceae bacterium]|jgi:putative tricarboxylic transport membrane protein
MKQKKFKIKKKQDFFLGVFFAIFGVLYLIGAVQLPDKNIDALGAGFLPKILGGLAVLCGVIQAVTQIGIAEPETKQEQEEGTETDMKKVGLSLLLLLAAVFSIEYVGFIIVGSVYVFLQILLLSPQKKRGWLYAVLAILISVGVYVMFKYMFHIMLPNGLLKNII